VGVAIVDIWILTDKESTIANLPAANSSFKNKGRRINTEPIIFIEQQEVNQAEIFQIPLLLKAVKR
jgi:hypothetical protein